MAHTFTTSNLSNTYTVASGATVGGITLNTGGITNATYSTAWAQQPTKFNDGTNPVMSIPAGSKTIEIDKAATLDVQGNVKINGIDLEERLKTIERLLLIPERDATMEAKYPSLKKKYDEYINTLEKYRTFDRIKGDNNGTT